MALEDLLAQAASATQQVGGQGGNPNGMTTFGPTPIVQPPPAVRFQPPQLQRPQAGNEFQTVSGNKRATKQAALSGIASFIKAGSDYVTAKKTRTLQMNIERLMEAQQGLQESKAALEQNPNDPKAKQAVEHNTAIVNDITKDPKINKQLQKAFNIDLFGNGKNKQENQALIEAWKNYDKKQQAGDKTALNPNAERLMQGQPMRQQLDPQTAMQAQLIKMGINPKADTVLRANTDLTKAIISAKTAEERTAAIEAAAKNRAEAEVYHADKLVDAANVRVLGAKGVAEINSRARVKVAEMNSATWDKRLAILKDKQGTNPIFKSISAEATSYLNTMKGLITENKAAQAELDKRSGGVFGLFGRKNVTDADEKLLRNKIETNNLRLQTIEGNLKETQQKLKNLNDMGLLKIDDAKDEADHTDVNDDEVPE